MHFVFFGIIIIHECVYGGIILLATVVTMLLMGRTNPFLSGHSPSIE